MGYGKLFWILRLNAAEVGRSLGKGRGRGSPNGLIRPDLRSDRVAVLRSDVHQRVGEEPEICRSYGQEIEGQGAKRSAARQVTGDEDRECESGEQGCNRPASEPGVAETDCRKKYERSADDGDGGLNNLRPLGPLPPNAEGPAEGAEGENNPAIPRKRRHRDKETDLNNPAGIVNVV